MNRRIAIAVAIIASTAWLDCKNEERDVAHQIAPEPSAAPRVTPELAAETSWTREKPDTFWKAVTSGRYGKAYDEMCPEYREDYGKKHFERGMDASPYLQDIKTTKLRASKGVGHTMRHTYSVVSKYGAISADTYVRKTPTGICVMSVTIAGLPVVGYGFPPGAKRKKKR